MLKIYRHYKGAHYRLICIARLESNFEEEMAVYQNATGLTIVRPLKEFGEWVTYRNEVVRRFEAVYVERRTD